MYVGEICMYRQFDLEIYNVINFLYKCIFKMKYNNDNCQKIVLSVLVLCYIVCSNGLMFDCVEVEYYLKLFIVGFFYLFYVDFKGCSFRFKV